MLGYVPKEIVGNVNVSSENPVLELLKLLAGVLATLALAYGLLGVVVDVGVPYLPPGIEQSMAGLYQPFVEGKARLPREEAAIQALVVRLARHLPQPARFRFHVHVVQSPEVNALALPAGHIVVYSGLLRRVGSENELAFVIGHELGHFVHYDHLRSLGRDLLLLAVAYGLLGPEHPAHGMLLQSVRFSQAQFSQSQELAADRLALTLLHRTYGRVDGAQDFFRTIARQRGAATDKGLDRFLSTHPQPAERLQAIGHYAKQKGLE